ncbi:hypothetical protein CsSME_00021383 [Camellia sinensis var. sinensis]
MSVSSVIRSAIGSTTVLRRDVSLSHFFSNLRTTSRLLPLHILHLLRLLILTWLP